MTDSTGATAQGSPHYLPHQIVWRVMANGISTPVIEPIVSPPQLAGRLTIFVIRAKRLHNVTSFGSMDPYVEGKVGEMRAKTSIAKRGGQSPEWRGEKLEYLLSGHDTHVRLRVFHKTLLSETVIGTARIPLDFLLLHHGRSGPDHSLATPTNSANPTLNSTWIDLGREAKQSVGAGSLLISVHFEVAGVVGGLLANAQLPPMDAGRAQLFVPTVDYGQQPQQQQYASNVKQQQRPAVAPAAAPAPAAPSSVAVPYDPSAVPMPSPVSVTHHVASSNAIVNIMTPRGSVLGVPSALAGVVAAASAAASQNAVVAAPTPRLKLFGGPLEHGMLRSKSSVPVVVFICVSYLLHHGLKCVGLFRISSLVEQQEALKRAFESGSAIEVSDANVTGDVLKTYFRQLEDPLIPSALYQAFLNATDLRRPETSVPALKLLIDQLPMDNRVVLSYLLHFFVQVSMYSEVNKMTTKNLALVWSPNLLRKSAAQMLNAPVETQASMAREMQRSEDCIHLLMLHYSALFPEGPPTPFTIQPTNPGVGPGGLGLGLGVNKDNYRTHSIHADEYQPPATLSSPLVNLDDGGLGGDEHSASSTDSENDSDIQVLGAPHHFDTLTEPLNLQHPDIDIRIDAGGGHDDAAGGNGSSAPPPLLSQFSRTRVQPQLETPMSGRIDYSSPDSPRQQQLHHPHDVEEDLTLRHEAMPPPALLPTEPLAAAESAPSPTPPIEALISGAAFSSAAAHVAPELDLPAQPEPTGVGTETAAADPESEDEDFAPSFHDAD